MSICFLPTERCSCTHIDAGHRVAKAVDELGAVACEPGAEAGDVRGLRGRGIAGEQSKCL